MARPLRRDIAGGWYHVTARGEHRKALYGDDRDRRHFLELLEEMRKRYRVKVLAYVLMENHYHLMVATPEANLSRAMQWLNVSYSVWFNRRRQEVGHVFQGRFKAIVVEGESWGLLLSEYLHLNPIRLKMLGQGKRERRVEAKGLGKAPDPEMVKRRLVKLRNYRWSSYRAYAGYGSVPEWLEPGEILARACGAVKYRGYVEERVRQGIEESPWEQVKWGLVLGTESFTRGVRKRLTGGREMPGKTELRQRMSFDEVVKVVERLSGESWCEFRDRHGDRRRDLVLWVARQSTGLTLGELGEGSGGMDYAAVTMAIRRFPEACERDKALGRLVKQVLKECGKLYVKM